MKTRNRILSGYLAIGTFTAVALAGCGGANGPDVEGLDTGSSELAATPTTLSALGNLAGRYSGEVVLPTSGLGLSKETRKVGLLLERMPDNKTYMAIVIRYTNFFKDNLSENLGRGIERVVEKVSVYRAAPKSDNSTVLSLQPLVLKNGTLMAVDTQQQLSELRISPRQNRGIGGASAALRNKVSLHQAVITAGAAGAAGESLPIRFDTFLENAAVPTSTWDREFIADKWEDTYVFADTLAKTKKTEGRIQLDVSKPATVQGSYTMTEVNYRADSKSALQKITGLYAMTPAVSGAANPLASHLGIFIDVVNRKKIGFKTRELFLIEPTANGDRFSESNQKGFIMYFQRDFMNFKPQPK